MPLADDLASPLVDAYAEVWDELTEELTTLTRPEEWRRRRRIRELLASIDDYFDTLDGYVRQFTDRELREIYGLGAARTAEEIGVRGAFTLQSNEAIEALENGLRGELLKQNAHSNRFIKREVRRTARTVTRGSVIGGEPAKRAAASMAESLRGRGFATIRYNNGSFHTIDEYAEMAVRTTTARAYNEGSFQLGKQEGIKFYEVFDGPTCGWTEHNDPDLADGKVVTADEARGNDISHPNCRRSFGARPDLTEKPDGRVPHRNSPPTSAKEARERAQLESGSLIRRRNRRRDRRGIRAERDGDPGTIIRI